MSRTFEGRDRFAPAAPGCCRASIWTRSAGPCHDPVLLDLPRRPTERRRTHGRIVQEDRFGNLITNIDRRTFDAFVHAPRVQHRRGGRRA